MAKEKLQHVNTYAPGTVLPKELLPGADLLDKDLAHQNKSNVPKSRVEQLSEMLQAVSREIQDRESYIERMAELGKGQKAINQVQHEIDSRIIEMEKISDMIRQSQ